MHTLMFSDRKRYCKALAVLGRSSKYHVVDWGRDYSPNIIRPWSTMFYITFLEV